MDFSNYNRNRDEIWCSWPVIIIWLYFFFPVGIYLLIKKQKLHRRNIFTIGRKTFSTGISLLIVSLFLYIPKLSLNGYTNKESEDYKEMLALTNTDLYKGVIIIANVLLVAAFIVIIISIFQRLKCNRYRMYISLVVNRDIGNFDEIASKMNLSKRVVIKDLKTMIKNNYLENYDIAEEENRIFNIQDEKERKRLAEKSKEENTRLVKCPNCGANNLLVEKIGKCSFCNSYIE